MSNQDQNSYYTDLISKYLSKEASEAEIKELEAWVLADAKHKGLFIAMKKAWILSAIPQANEAINTENAWKKTASTLFDSAKTIELKPRKRTNFWLGIAASISLIIIALWLLFAPGEDRNIMVESTKTVEQVELPDGSSVVLNQGSSLDYSFDAAQGLRKVNLEGDAFFDVAKDKNTPFRIRANGLEVSVLGTAFYIDARSDQEEVNVILESGLVEVKSDKERKQLTPGQKATFAKGAGTISVVENEDQNFNFLKSNTLIFDNSALSQVVFDLNRQYHANIIISNTLIENCTITATYRNKSLDAILDIIETTLPSLSITKKQNEILIDGTSCE